jgi:hypothetical protein
MKATVYLVACACGCLLFACVTPHVARDQCPAQVPRTDPPVYVHTGPPQPTPVYTKKTTTTRTTTKKTVMGSSVTKITYTVAKADCWTCPAK